VVAVSFGVFAGSISTPNHGLQLDHTIVAGNGFFTGTDVFGPVFANFSFIGIGEEFLGPLADNGGPTKTHALLAGSPAIDAGDPNFDPADPDGDPLTDDALPYDQRGAPFGRVFDGNSNGVAQVDIGAYELQPQSILGDYNLNGAVDAADYVVWRKTLGTSVSPPFVGADGSGNGQVGAEDHNVWRAHFGNTLSGVGAGTGVSQESRAEGQGSSVGVLRVSASESQLRIADFGLRIGNGREWKSETESTLTLTLTLSQRERGLTDNALVAWLSSRGGGREEDAGNSCSELGDGQDFPSYEDAIDDEWDTLDVAFAALAGGI
jgi:hypothetical protein